MLSDEEPSVVYGLDYQARCLIGLDAEQERVHFLVGTQTLRSENQLCLLDLDDDTNKVSKCVFAHSVGEICRPSDVQMQTGCTVWQMDHDSTAENFTGTLSEVSAFAAEPGATIGGFEWQPAASGAGKACCIHDAVLSVVDGQLDGRTMRVAAETRVKAKGGARVVACKWHPHHGSNVIATAVDGALRGVDVRDMQTAFAVDNAHSPLVRSLDFNPNRQYVLASCGDDCKTKLWDIRQPSAPLASIGQHSHWVWSVRFNPIHDQLLLTCSSDARLMLHCLASLSSDNRQDDGDDDEATPKQPLQDGLLRKYEEHEESVYSCAWSSADPWTFAALSYDGRVIFNRVPRAVKYQILRL